MATRMQQRRGTASQWVSSNDGDGPILNAGEIGWESDTNKFKIGDGVSYWADLDYFSDVNSTINPAFGTSIVFEGATADSYETTLQVTDPTADRTITLPNVDGTVITTGNLSDITNIGVFTSTIVMEGSTADAHELTLSAGDPTADRTITFPDATGTVALAEDVSTSLGDYVQTSDIGAISGVAGLNGSQNLLVPGASIIVEGATDNAYETTLTVTDPTASRTITFPDATGTVALAENVAALSGATFTGAVSGTDLTLSGDLTVNGTTTNINSTNLVVEDKNVVLGDTTSPTDTTADGGGITLKGTTDKTFNWVDATDAWTSSEHINLASGKSLYLNGTIETAATQTLTNKTIDGASNTLTVRLANDISGFGSGVATFLATPSSANLASAVTDETGSGALVFGTSPSIAAPTLTGSTKIAQILETATISATAAGSTVNYDVVTNGGVTYYTSNSTGNWTLNIRGNGSTTLNSIMSTGQSLTIAFLATNATAYYQSGFQVDGNAVTPKWQGGTAPSAGNASSVDIYSITVIKTGNAAFTAFAAQTKFA